MSWWFSWFTAQQGDRRKPTREDETSQDGEPGPSTKPCRKRKISNSSDSEAKKLKVDDRKCPICLNKMKSKDLTATPCAHLFCTHCLLQAYEYSPICPLCRLPVEEDQFVPPSALGDGNLEATEGNEVESTEGNEVESTEGNDGLESECNDGLESEEEECGEETLNQSDVEEDEEYNESNEVESTEGNDGLDSEEEEGGEEMLNHSDDEEDDEYEGDEV